MSNLPGARWHKSTRSGQNGGDCVEVADNLPGAVHLRDSKDRTGPILTINHTDWSAFITGLKRGDLGR